ncbi:MAG: ADP-ribosyltransferase domain-containing protein [Oligoflexia bacterium]|nr:ADP-ribosyltransferase domain-containing protein [Oligoflexia bacterium]
MSLRTGERLLENGPSIEAMRRGLKKLPVFRGTVRRGVSKLPAEVLAEHQEGATVTYSAFTSTSKGQGYFLGKIVFKIDSKSGRDLDVSNFNRQEKEVIFLPGTRFKVLKREKLSEEIYQFELEEVD